jgi:hypothetical protein
MVSMESNVGKIDRIFRLIFGVAFVLVGLIYLAAPISYVVVVVGLILLVTGLVGYCSVYSILGINTVGHPICDVEKEEEHMESSEAEMMAPMLEDEPFLEERPAPPPKKAKKKPKKAKRRKRKKK